MNKKNIIRVLLYILVIIWMTVIFYFSNMNKDNSDNTSKSLLYKIVSITNKNTNESEKIRIVDNYNIIIRKIAHISEYFILSLLIYLSLIYSDITNKKAIIYSIIISILYSITDEIHQLFIPGRGGQIKDIFIDSTGVFLNTLIIIIKNKVK